jgi:bifunctional non-homologous end joining protein LigD
MAAKKSKEAKPAPLETYRAKRAAHRTHEPFGSGPPRPRLFVVQKHDASHLHYDLRLEMGGVLQSWAVPKGPSLDPETKRLAMLVEQHPMEYADFEGIIPAGEYGAGAVVLWDRGRWEPIGHTPEDGLRDGKLLFDLYGHKLQGRWTLFRLKKANDWLMVKKPDAYADPGRELDERSILSGLTVQELKAGVNPAARARRRLARSKLPRNVCSIHEAELMLARSEPQPFTRKGWLFELKYDGFRLLCAREDGKPRLRYRRGSDATTVFPELAAAIKKIPYESFLIDGEVVVPDQSGHPSFSSLQQRVHLARPHDIARATVERPAVLYAFDLLALEGYDLRSLPLRKRKEWLSEILPASGPLRYSDHIEEQGEAMFRQVREMGLEGIMAKRAASTYQAGRSGDWLKMRCDFTGPFVIVGYTRPKRGRAGFGALHVAIHDGSGLRYAGRVGTGFDDGTLKELRADLDALHTSKAPCGGLLPSGDDHRWARPELICDVRYKQWTGAGHLRHPVYLGQRDDLQPEDCVAPDLERPEEPPAPPTASEPERRVSLTNLDKVFWPEEGYTKGDLIEYYRQISSWLLPYLADRPVVLTRYPDGIGGKNFYQKDAPEWTPEWVRTESIWSESTQKEIRYFVCDHEESLLYLANLGAIPLHLWSSRASSLPQPDWCILDLDPKEAPFEHVVKIARAIRELCDEIGLPCFVKTSGSTGLHVLLPLGRQCTYDQSRAMGELLARVIVNELPDIATVTRSPSRRGGKVYIDFLQNRHGQLLVSPFCVRPLPKAPVSAPLSWKEVNRGLHIERFTMENVVQRMRRLKEDPLRPVLDLEPDLLGGLQKLHAML